MRPSPQTEPSGSHTIDVHPLTVERWGDLARLFGPAGAEEGCWDMFWRMRSKEYGTHSRELKRLA